VSTIENLLALQEKDNRILQLERELKDIPERKKMELERLEEHRREVEEAETLMKAKQASMGEFELEVESHKEQISKLRQQQLDLKTNQEFKAMDSEIDNVEKKIDALEDQQLAMMDEIETVSTSLAIHKQELSKEEGSVKRDCQAWDDRASVLQKDLKAAQVEREEAVKGVTNTELFTNYQRVHSRRENALVAVVDGICGGCHMQLPPYVVHEVKKQAHIEDGVVSCDYCGRLLHVG
jgi:predicted  nucleic acid-binding Zn-ribbon protein